jgi:hypothetical protein
MHHIVCELSAGNKFFMWHFVKRDLIKLDVVSPPLEKSQRHAEQNVI